MKNISESYKNKLMRLSGIKGNTLTESSRTDFLKNDFIERAGRKYDRFLKFYSKGIWDINKENDNFVKNVLYKQIIKNGKVVPKNSWLESLVKSVFNQLVKQDPTENKQYLNWLINIYLSGNLLTEDFYKIPETITLFNKNKDKLPIDQRNINTFDNLNTLYNAVLQYDSAEEMSAAEKDKIIKLEGAEQVYEDSNWKIIIPKTKDAACLYGKSTRWCTASVDSNMFQHYNKQGPLYVLIDKRIKNDRDVNKKLQFHFQSNQFMDTTDKGIKLTHFFKANPELISFFEKRGDIDAAFKIDNMLVSKEEGLKLLKTAKDKVGLINKKSYDFFEKFYKEMGAEKEFKNIIVNDNEFLKELFFMNKNLFEDLMDSYVDLGLQKEGLNALKKAPWLNSWILNEKLDPKHLETFIVNLMKLGQEGKEFAWQLCQPEGVIWNALVNEKSNSLPQYLGILTTRKTFGTPGLVLAKKIISEPEYLAKLKARKVGDTTLKMVKKFIDVIKESSQAEIYLRNILR